MKREVQKFNSFSDAEDADVRYYRSLTHQQRLDLLLELIARQNETDDEAAKGFARVCRVIALQRR
jgi:hypothetical protein